jgi:hypothetical protein
MVRRWNRLLDMPIARIGSSVYQWDLSRGGAWATEMSDLFQWSDCDHLYKNKIKTSVFKKNNVMQYAKKMEMNQKPKSRTFCLIKDECV